MYNGIKTACVLNIKHYLSQQLLGKTTCGRGVRTHEGDLYVFQDRTPLSLPVGAT